MASGVVKWFNSRKGYGFITPEGAGESDEDSDIFVHHSNISMEGFRVLYQDDKVDFEIEQTEKGLEAKIVEVTERAPRRRRRRKKSSNASTEDAMDDEAAGDRKSVV